MTAPETNQAQPQQQPTDKEINFRNLEAKYQRELQQERAARQEAERLAQEAMSRKSQSVDEDDDSSEPYVDHKRLAKQFSSFEKRMDEKIDKKAEEKARTMVAETRKSDFLRNNPDFYEVLQHAEKFAQNDPDLAESILEMPESFERQKLVYKNIKALGLHKPEVKQPSIQEKVDANRRSPYYQPSGVASAPYSGGAGDFSPTGQKSAYQKMQELKNKLRL